MSERDEPAAAAGTWYAAKRADDDVRPRLNVELDVDVCVIGAGLAGLTAAREIALKGWSVVVLEAGRIGGAASGRNTGFVIPGFAADPRTIAERVGREDARELWALSERGLDYVRNTVRSLRLRGADLTPGGWLHVSKTDDEAERIAFAEHLTQELGASVEHWPTDRVRATLRSPLYFGAIHYQRGFAINPLNYALGLAAAAEAAGARIFERTPALALDPAGVRKRVTTPAGRLRAAHVVVAGNVQAGGLLPALGGTLTPITTYVMVTAPLGERLHAAVGTKAAVSDTELANNHYRIVDGDRLMWSGRTTVWQRNPRRFVGALKADIARAYPQLGPVEADFAWRGTLGNTVHRMPQVGELMPGVWLLSGFGGHGLNTTAMGGNLVARAIADGDRTWRLFAPFHLVWTGGLVGRAAAQVYAWSYARRERLDSWLARRRAGEEELPLPEPVAAAVAEAPPALRPAEPPRAARQAVDKPGRRRGRPRRTAQQQTESDNPQSVNGPDADSAPR